MTHTAENTDGYEALSAVSDAMIAAVIRDMAEDPRDILRIFREVSAVNSDVADAILTEARKVADDHLDPEAALIQGATLIIRMLVKQGKTQKLHDLLFPDGTAQCMALRPHRPIEM